jgi:hypothetical protein
MVSTPGFHPGDRSSILRGVIIVLPNIIGLARLAIVSENEEPWQSGLMQRFTKPPKRNLPGVRISQVP